MREIENHNTEYKSLKKVTSGDKGLRDLAGTCVCFANAQGGVIYIGIENKKRDVPVGQVVTEELVNTTLTSLRQLTQNVHIIRNGIEVDVNGGEYFSITIQPSIKSIATTSDGRIFIRVGDECQPVRSEDIVHLANQKDAFQWELQSRNIAPNSDNVSNISWFANQIRQSDRVKDFVKAMSDIDIAEQYNLITNGVLTNLGVLWIGDRVQRARLAYPITVQYIVYDDSDKKVRKEDWHDYSLNPMQLLLDIEDTAVEMTYYDEFPQGLFRNKIRHYDPRVIRELLINAFAHKSYTSSGDVFINLYPDRLEIKNTGGLPLGVTADNILRTQQRRNPHLIRVLHDLKLMEGEGSGYDLIYEITGRDGKSFPKIITDFNSVTVIQESKILDPEAIMLLDFISKNYTLSQNDLIVLSIICRHKKILSTTLTKELQLTEEERMRSYVKRLLSQNIIITVGRGKANSFLVNPKLIASSKINVKPTLKTIEMPRLKALIEEILKVTPNVSISEIEAKIEDIPREQLQRTIYRMVRDGALEKSGGKAYRLYRLAEKKTSEKEN